MMTAMIVLAFALPLIVAAGAYFTTRSVVKDTEAAKSKVKRLRSELNDNRKKLEDSRREETPGDTFADHIKLIYEDIATGQMTNYLSTAHAGGDLEISSNIRAASRKALENQWVLAGQGITRKNPRSVVIVFPDEVLPVSAGSRLKPAL